jgi:hypothetical protein
MMGSFADYSLTPSRKQFPDIFNYRPPLFEEEERARTDLDRILATIARQCKSGRELEQNEEVVILLHGFSEDRVEVSRELPYASLRLGEDRFLWIKKYLVIDGRPVLVFVDPRGGQGLTEESRRVVYSAMNAGVREIDSDFRDARMLIIQLPRLHGCRFLRLHWGDGEPLFSYAELQEMATVTERLWIEAQIVHERRRRGGGGGVGGATGTTGPLL